jgi:AbrB family looped-hinge helix DNA binding protein
MAITTVSTKGQILIPSKIRRKLNINKGTKIYIEEKENEITLKPITPEAISNIAGMLATGGELTKDLLKERAKDREREDSDIEKNT